MSDVTPPAGGPREDEELPAPGSLRSPDGRVLLVDYGGVLTPGLGTLWEPFEEEHGIPRRRLAQVLWSAYGEDGGDSAVARVERGELSVAAFDESLAEVLREDGHDVGPEGLVRRLLAGLAPGGGVWRIVDDVRRAGVPAVLVSNSWGLEHYPMALLEARFDELVISGRLGIRKPDREIFVHAVEAVGGSLDRAVMVDDGEAVVDAVTGYGATGVLHTGDDGATRAAVASALDLTLT